MCGAKLKRVQCAKDMGVKIASNLKFLQQCVDAANIANRMLGFIKRNFSFKNKDVILPLYTSLVRPHLEYAVQFWSSHEERLSTLNMFSQEKRRLWGKLIECFKILNGFTNVDRSKVFMIDDTLRMRNNGIKLQCRQVNSDCTKFFFTNVVVREWNKLPPSVVQYNTIDSFKNKLDRHFLELNIN